MSDIIEGADELFDESVEAAGDAVKSSAEAADDVGLSSEEASEEKKSLLSSFSIFDAMLLASLVCVTLATLILFFELRTFGDFPGGFPWRTNEITIQ